MPITIKLRQIEETYLIEDDGLIVTVVFWKNFGSDLEETTVISNTKLNEYQHNKYVQAVINHRNGRL